MSKSLFFFTLGSLNFVLLVLFNANPIITSGIITICMFFIFQATFPPMTNIWSYWMANLDDRVKAVRKHDAFSEEKEVTGEVWNLNNEKLDKFPKSESSEVGKQ